MRERGDAIAGQEMHLELAGEKRAQIRIEHVEPAGIGAEGGQHQALRVADEAAAGETPPAHIDARLGVIVTAHFARGEERLGDVAEGERAEPQRALDGAAAEPVGRHRIVVAGDPHELAVRGKRGKKIAVSLVEPRRRLAVMKTVAEADEARNLVLLDDVEQPFQSGARVVGRQHDAVPGEARAFLEMEVGDDEGALLGPEERAFGERQQRRAGEVERERLGEARAAHDPVLCAGAASGAAMPASASSSCVTSSRSWSSAVP
jgi:hypothetical protein